jgi:type IV pilus assembly protein PilY1
MMNMNSFKTRTWVGRCAAAVYGTATALFLTVSAPDTFAQALPAVAQAPLSVAGNVPGNVALALSVEFPTAISMAHQGSFVTGTRYVGYFNPNSCYRYYVGTAVDDTTNTGNDVSHFYPVGATDSATDYECTGSGLTDTWSGSFLNWLTMQSVDPFRQALTGGYRRVDTASTTILERAWSPNGGGAGQGNDDNFPPIPRSSGNWRLNRSSPTDAQIADHTPLGFSCLKASVRQRGNEFLIGGRDSSGPGSCPSIPGVSLDSSTPAPAIPNTGTHQSTTTFAFNTIYRFYARVKVCDSVGRESNCRPYSSGWKPEGLLQDYSRRMRFSAFGYLNDPTDDARDGGVLRAKQKYVGPEVIVPGGTPTSNANKEWDETTGVFITNPDSADASATASTWGVTVANSGVINYVNKFGQEQHTYKRRDPVGELYYAALRYLKNQGNVTNWMPSTSDANKTRLIDSFPVIETWNDPVQYQCQNNFILGIGDTNSSWDQNLPGTTTDTGNQPGTNNFAGASGKPAAVTADATVDAGAKRTKVRALNSGLWGGASDLIAGLAYHAATEDIRPDIANLTVEQPRGQNVQTYWLDVLEFGAYTANNQYYLATKFGGLNIPAGTAFNPVTATAASIPNSWWTTNGETTPDGRPRPDNYFTVDNPQAMISGLERTFARISARGGGSGSSLAANSVRLDLNTRTFQAQFTGAWSGELRSYVVDDVTGALDPTPEWTTRETSLGAHPVTSLDPANWAARQIYTHDPANNTLLPFRWANLSSAQQTSMVSSDVVDYIRGNQAREETQLGGIFRTRVNGLLGDIVNSTPVFVAQPNSNLYNATMAFPGASTYQGFVSAQSARTGILWVGANDGMLHAFEAATGQEVYAFVPKRAIANGLASVASPNYAHRYFVDGDITVADVYDTGTSSWRTILVGTMGRGGPGVFALDVTTPTVAGITLLWDKDGSDIPGLGRNIGKPVIAQTASGTWQVLIGNGPGGSGGIAQLVAINVLTGAVTTTSAGGAGSNGLSAVLARDTDGDRIADVAYAGDLTGRLLKFTGLSGTPSVTTMFNAVDPANAAQPITAAPMVGRDPATGISWVFFGTGQYLTSADPATTQTQSWYGIQDDGTVPTRSDFLQRSVVDEAPLSGFTVRTVSLATAGDMAGKKGWFLDLPASRERMVVPNQFQGGALIGTSRIPDNSNVCQPSGRGFVMAINPFTGARLTQTFFDITGEGTFDDADKLVVSGTPTIISGVGFDSSPNAPIFVGNVMQVSLDDGTTRTMRTQGSAVDSRRLTWREIRN